MIQTAPEPIEVSFLRQFLPKRDDFGHKGSFGSALMIAGSRRYTGAVLLAGRACLRTGVGLLYMAVPESLHPALAGHLPEAIWDLLPEEEATLCPSSLQKALQSLANKTALLIGPGLGLTTASRSFGQAFLKAILPQFSNLPTVIDADMLTILSETNDWRDFLPRNTILTPHPGEMARLTSLSLEDIQTNRASIARSFAQEKQVILVLKGANTLVTAPDGTQRILPFAHSVLSHAGSGDTLAGILTGLLAQGTDPFGAACLAVWLHAKSGMLALHERAHAAAVLPSDLIGFIGQAMATLEEG